MDLDFITHSKLKEIEVAMQSLNFSKSKSRYFVHPESEFIIEFPSPPLSIGNKPINNFVEIIESSGYLKLLTPTNCVMDRLAAYYYWNDLQCLEQAILVAANHTTDLSEVKKWSKEEGMEKKYKIFLEKLKTINSKH